MWNDLLKIAGVSFGAAVVVSIPTWLLLRWVRVRSVAVSFAIAIIAAIVSMCLGVIIAGSMMAVTPHDRNVTLVVLGCSTVVTAIILWWLARDVRREAVWADAVRSREDTLEKSHRELVAWVSHDLRTPLAGIRAMAEALEDGVANETETVAHYHRQMRIESDRMAMLVDDLFEVARINAGAVALPTSAVDLGDILSDALASAAPLARASQVALNSEPLRGAIVIGSSPELGRVVRNLLTNAIRFSHENGTVRVMSGREGNHVWFSISDSCGGINEADLPQVFDVAFRGEIFRPKEESADSPGGGLGLAIARGLVEAHAGTIDIDNVADGCQVTVRLPTVSH
ncbi:MAG: HAMP domain-containing sensor histidine kinase [Antricoccus sp.]